MTRLPLGVVIAALFASCAGPCGKTAAVPPAPIEPIGPTTIDDIPGHGAIPQDKTRKEGPRMVRTEAYIRSYLTLFGGLAPLAAQARLRGQNLFDTWDDYLSVLGLPDYKLDIPRISEPSALMVAAFERLGVALCDRTVLNDLRGAKPIGERLVFAFALTEAAPTEAEFAERFDVLHRTFLGYPARLAPAQRARRFLQLYQDTVARHGAPDAGTSLFTPAEAGWATVCYGLVRHPEFHLY